ncbi:MAG: FAD-linked oxidase C-terminal domain-containing protein [Desulfobacterales bacterium]
MPTYTPITDDIRRRISDVLGDECIVTNQDEVGTYSKDASGLSYPPELVIRVQETAQIQRLMRLANEYSFPVIPRGGGSGLAGGCLPVLGGVVLSLEKLNRIISVDTQNLIAKVQPGTITKDLRDAVQQKKLFFPPDPAGMDQSTIGGNAATNAGGPSCVKYGTTKDYILGLEAVLPSGRMINTGTQTRKGVVGYDLTQLLVGSEGTLGIITGLILKLIPYPASVNAVTAVFSDLPSAMQAVTQILNRGHLPSAIEFLDAKFLLLVKDILPFHVPGKKSTLLIIEVDGDPAQTKRDIKTIGKILKEVGATHLLPAFNEKEREDIWNVRRQVSLRIHDNYALYIPEDVAVPIGKIPALVAELPKLEAEYGFEIYAFGHAGDGNIHLNITAQNRDNMNRVEMGVKAILARVIQMGGTISGEHGIGQAKKRYLSMELSAESIRLQTEIKKVFDPNMILNPGKIFPEKDFNNRLL